MTAPRLIYPCPPYNAISNPFDGPPSVAGQRIHGGVDFPAPNGTKLLSPPKNSKVVFAGYAGTAGYMVELYDAAAGLTVRLLHGQQPIVITGQVVAGGDQVGWSNNTGVSTGSHVHMDCAFDTKAQALKVQDDPELVYEKWRVDPERLLSAVEEDDMLFVIRPASNPGDLWVLEPGRGRRHLSFPEWKILENQPGVKELDPIADADFNAIPVDRYDRESWGMWRYYLGPGDNDNNALLLEGLGGTPALLASEKANGAAQRKLTPWFHPQTGWEQGIEP